MRPNDTDLLAWVDGELDADRADAVARAVAHDPALARHVGTLSASRLPLREAYERAGTPPVPPALVAGVEALVAGTSPDAERPPTPHGASPRPIGARWTGDPPASDASHRLGDGTRGTGARAAGRARRSASARPGPVVRRAAAAVALALGAGAIGHAVGERAAPGRTAAADTADAWVHRVADYQSLYVRGTIDRPGIDPADSAALLAELGDRAGLDPRVPDLEADGFRFVRAQELGWRGEPLVQLVYLDDAGGAPLALCFMPDDETGERGLELGTRAGLATATWRRDGQRFVLVGDLAPDTLETLHRRVVAAWRDAA